jgi:hypothetical protein
MRHRAILLGRDVAGKAVGRVRLWPTRRPYARCASFAAHRRRRLRRACAHTKMGAGIAADPLSPDFDPLDTSSSEEPFAPAPSGFGGPFHPRRKRQQASRFRSPGRARYSCEPQRSGLGGRLSVRASPSTSPRPRKSNRFPLLPKKQRCASGHRGQHPLVGRGDVRECFGSTVLASRTAPACAFACPGCGGPAALPRTISFALRRSPSFLA